METVGVKQLRDNLSRILKRVEGGEVVKVLRHGKDVVELRPIRKNAGQEFLNRLKDKNLLAGEGIGAISLVKTVKNLKPESPVSDFIAEDRKRLHISTAVALLNGFLTSLSWIWPETSEINLRSLSPHSFPFLKLCQLSTAPGGKTVVPNQTWNWFGVNS